MNIAYLLLGGNLGEREKNLTRARALIARECGTELQASAVYETMAWGKTDQPAFLNQALCIATGLDARQLMRKLLKVERLLGRVREEKYGPRLIDIDILLFNNEVHEYPQVRLPHPQLQNRRFALVPLSDIAGEKTHPVLGKSIRELLNECTDELPVNRHS